MVAPALETKNLRLAPHAPEHLRALIEGPEFYAQRSGMTPANGLREFIASPDVSPEWLASLKTATGSDPWRYGFAVVHRESEMVIGTAGFTGPPDADGVFEIANSSQSSAAVPPKYLADGPASRVAGDHSLVYRLVPVHAEPVLEPAQT